MAHGKNDTPAHPGPFIRTEVLEPLGLSVTAAAKLLGLGRPSLSNVLNGQWNVSAGVALRVEKVFGLSMDTLLRMQLLYDIAVARRQEKVNPLPVKRYRKLIAKP